MLHEEAEIADLRGVVDQRPMPRSPHKEADAERQQKANRRSQWTKG